MLYVLSILATGSTVLDHFGLYIIIPFISRFCSSWNVR